MNVTLLMAVMSGNVQSLLQWSPDNPQLLLALHSVSVLFLQLSTPLFLPECLVFPYTAEV